MDDRLREIHGDGICHICGKPKAAAGSEFCSYPHALVPVEQVASGMSAWAEPSTTPNKR